MSIRWQPLHDLRPKPAPAGARTASAAPATPGAVQDQLQRPLREMRISVTDRCNFRCTYCMPRAVFAQHRFLAAPQLLGDDEIVRIASQALALGVRKLRITGGEPLLRRGLPALMARLAQLRQANGDAPELCLTTNGVRLPQLAANLKAAGLDRLTVSLDALDPATFARMSDTRVPVQAVLDGIAAAQAAGLGRGLKVNMVVQRGVNDAQVLPMARHFRGQGVALRFIEYMDVGSSNGWRMDQVLPSAQLLALLQAEFSLVASPTRPGETAQRWLHTNAAGEADAQLGEVGFISSVSQAFCASCTRARLSADGRLFSCLFAHQGLDLRTPLRAGASDAQLQQTMADFWSARHDQYSQLRQDQASTLDTAPGSAPDAASAPQTGSPRIEMSYIGG